MARDFTRADRDRIDWGDLSQLDFDRADDFTIYLWFQTVRLDVEAHIIHKWGSDGSEGTFPFKVVLAGNSTNDPIRLTTFDGSSSNVNFDFPGTTNEWIFTMCGRDTAQTDELFITAQTAADRNLALPAFVRANDATSGTLANAATFRIGDWPFGGAHFDGQIAHVIICNAAHPKNIGESVKGGRLPPDIVFFAPLYGASSPEPDFSGNAASGTLGSTGGSVDQADHAPVAAPFGFSTDSFVVIAASGGGGGTTITRDITDSFTFSDSLERDGQWVRSESDTFSFSDTLSRSVEAVRSLTDTFSFSDTLSRAGSRFVRTLSDSLNFSEDLDASGEGVVFGAGEVVAKLIRKAHEFISRAEDSSRAHGESAADDFDPPTLSDRAVRRYDED